jgi:hypothetical protein
MKNSLYIVIILALILTSCEDPPAVVPETPKPSELIFGKWENRIYETGNEYYYLTFSPGSYIVEYTDGTKTISSDAGVYFLNDVTNEIELEDVLIRDYEAGKIYTYSMPDCYVTFSNRSRTMTWDSANGSSYLFNKL